MKSFLLLVSISGLTFLAAFQTNEFRRIMSSRFKTLLHTIPYELVGKLDPTKSWPVKFVYEDKEVEAIAPESLSLLEVGEKIFKDLPSSCRNGHHFDQIISN